MSIRPLTGVVLPVLLLGGAWGAWQASDRVDADTEPPEAVVTELDATTSVLSARRLPETLAWPVVRDALASHGADAVAASPPTSCVVYRTLERDVFASNPDLALVPASNQKLVTTWAALEILGAETRFTTTVATAAAPDAAGVIDGDLFLIGGGDPFLSTAEWRDQFEEGVARASTSLEDLAQAVADAGITRVTGSLVGDETLFDTVRTGPWADRLVEQDQSGPLSALAVDEGFLDWPTPYVSAAARTQSDQPAVRAAEVFVRKLGEVGVVVEGEALAGAAPVERSVVASAESPTVAEIARHVNAYSNNYGAEILLKHLGLARRGEGSTAAGAAVVTELLEEEGLARPGVVILDGSGLAEGDRLTCSLLADLLVRAADDGFADLLSVGAEIGSLRSRYVGTEAAGLVFAKTGTLRDVSALSGYVESATEEDELVVFAYLANDAFEGIGGPQVQDELVGDLVTYPSGVDLEDLDPEPAVAAP